MVKNEVTLQIGERIRRLRLAENKTLGEIALATGITARTLGKIEKGEHNLNCTELLKIASYFNKTTNYLLNGYNDFESEELKNA